MSKIYHPEPKFTDSVLQLPVLERVQFFSDKQIRHPILDRFYEDLLIKATDVGGVEFVQLVGPTGAGKSSAAKKFAKDKYADCMELMREDPSMVPVVYSECPASASDRFPWKQLLKNILRAGGDALAESGRYALEHHEGVSQKEISKHLLKNNSVDDLMEVVRKFLLYRKVRYLIIDEAQHITDACRNSQEAFRCMEMLKSLANLSGSIIVLAGTYRLLRFGETSAQLARRSEIVELGPYKRGSEKDMEDFAISLDALLARYPIKFSSEIYKKVDEIHLGCCGCIGILKDWLSKTIYRTLKSGKEYVSYSALMANRMDARELKRVADEIRMGQEFFSRVAMSEVEDVLLGVKTKTHKTSGSRGVQRKPERDPVGVIYDDDL